VEDWDLKDIVFEGEANSNTAFWVGEVAQVYRVNQVETNLK